MSVAVIPQSRFGVELIAPAVVLAATLEKPRPGCSESVFRNPTTDVIVVLVIVLLIFGPKRIPLLGKELGRGIKEFKDSITTSSKDAEDADRSQLEQSTVAGPAATATTAREQQPASSSPSSERDA
jgi:sec-independent protein translocase protein TatA